MVVGPSGKRINIRAFRKCLKCGISTEHVCYGLRYEKPDHASESYVKHMSWACERCGESYEELKEVPEPTERLMLIIRLLKVGEDYDVKNVSIQSHGNRVILTVEFPDYDSARLRRLTYKMEEEGFINVAKLIELHEAGFRTERDREKLLLRPMRYRRKENVSRVVFNPDIGW